MGDVDRQLDPLTLLLRKILICALGMLLFLSSVPQAHGAPLDYLFGQELRLSSLVVNNQYTLPRGEDLLTLKFSENSKHWEMSGMEILHEIGGRDPLHFYGFSPQVHVIHNPMPIGSISSKSRLVFSSGMLSLIQSRSEYAFLIAHEVSHKMLGHSGHTTGGRNSPYHWSLAQEHSADLLALQLLRNSDFNQRDAINVLQRLEGFGSNSGGLFNRIYPSLSSRRKSLHSHLHPHS